MAGYNGLPLDAGLSQRETFGAMEQSDQAAPIGSFPSSPLVIEDYAIIGDCSTCAVVGRNGSIDWLCWPRFDIPACFSALLGDSLNGRWLIAPSAGEARTTRSYRGDSLILETVFETAEGSIAVVDFMPPFDAAAGAIGNSSVVRIVEGRSGRVAVRTELAEHHKGEEVAAAAQHAHSAHGHDLHADHRAEAASKLHAEHHAAE
jgi:GH15 family glucan-1,4-alpha-glucosidase